MAFRLRATSVPLAARGPAAQGLGDADRLALGGAEDARADERLSQLSLELAAQARTGFTLDGVTRVPVVDGWARQGGLTLGTLLRVVLGQPVPVRLE
jgi:hypothetical protein